MQSAASVKIMGNPVDDYACSSNVSKQKGEGSVGCYCWQLPLACNVYIVLFLTFVANQVPRRSSNPAIRLSLKLCHPLL